MLCNFGVRRGVPDDLPPDWSIRRALPSQYRNSWVFLLLPCTFLLCPRIEILINLSSESSRTLLWVYRDGREEPLGAPPNPYRFPQISQDGTRLAVSVSTAGKMDIWVWNFNQKTLTRLTFDEGGVCPLWTPDSERIVFSSTSKSKYPSVSWKAADGTGEVEQLGSMPDRGLLPMSLSSDGSTLVTQEMPPESTASLDIGIISMKGNREPKTLLHEKYGEMQPRISPDGQWMAYSSNESGHVEVYVRPFPEVNKGRWQISTGQEYADSPLWSPDSRKIFYRYADAVMEVSVKT